MVTVTGDAIKNPGNFKVKNGTNAAELVEAAGGFKSQPEKVISGGPMMGMASVSYTHLIANSMSTAMIPAISSSYALENYKKCNTHVKEAIHFTMIISIPAAIGMGALCLLYTSRCV